MFLADVERPQPSGLRQRAGAGQGQISKTFYARKLQL
jgi:hypothetical protein